MLCRLKISIIEAYCCCYVIKPTCVEQKLDLFQILIIFSKVTFRHFNLDITLLLLLSILIFYPIIRIIFTRQAAAKLGKTVRMIIGKAVFTVHSLEFSFYSTLSRRCTTKQTIVDLGRKVRISKIEFSVNQLVGLLKNLNEFTLDIFVNLLIFIFHILHIVRI